ncbi:MAG: hypothetical protein AAGF56_11760 [Pseudomonadota bacterium]
MKLLLERQFGYQLQEFLYHRSHPNDLAGVTLVQPVGHGRSTLESSHIFCVIAQESSVHVLHAFAVSDVFVRHLEILGQQLFSVLNHQDCLMRAMEQCDQGLSLG